MKKTPLIIAHRGSSGEAPENTLKAFDLAFKQEADGIELDIFLTKDKELVVTHDENLLRLTGQNIQTRKATLKELKKLDFGEKEKIPTLREVFEMFGKKFSVMNVEIKSTGIFSDGVEQALINLIEELNLHEKILISSFNPLHLLRIKKLAPDLQTGYLMHPQSWLFQQKFWALLCQVKTLNLEQNWCDENRLKKYENLQKQIWVWTVNTKFDMKKWLQQPIDAIITNYPARLRYEMKQVAKNFVG